VLHFTFGLKIVLNPLEMPAEHLLAHAILGFCHMTGCASCVMAEKYNAQGGLDEGHEDKPL